MDWQPSPVAGVWRKRLELAGAVEAGRVTSVVRFDPRCALPAPRPPDGEEILVLDGVFSDETGDYPAGSHFLNPDGTSHAPWSGPGCTLFVKLRQYPGAGRPRLAIDTASAVWRPGPVTGSELLGALPRPGARRGTRRAGPDGAGLRLGPGSPPGRRGGVRRRGRAGGRAWPARGGQLAAPLAGRRASLAFAGGMPSLREAGTSRPIRRRMPGAGAGPEDDPGTGPGRNRMTGNHGDRPEPGNDRRPAILTRPSTPGECRSIPGRPREFGDCGVWPMDERGEVSPAVLASLGEDPFGYRAEFIGLVRLARTAAATEPQGRR